MTRFPKNFKFGAAISGPQSEGFEGKKNDNVWDHFYKLEPDAFFDNVGPEITSNMYNTYKEDIQLLKQVGVKLYRTSIQWSRLIDNFETNTINTKAVKFYRDYFQTIKDAGIELIVNLYHFDTPMYWQDKGGWLSKEFVKAFGEYGKICFDLFGDQVDLWAAMNEPMGVPEGGYLSGRWYPKIKDFKKTIQVGYHEILGQAMVIKNFKKIFNGNEKKKISAILNVFPSYPKDKSEKNLKAAYIADLFKNRSFLDPSIKGTFPKDLVKYLEIIGAIPEHSQEELDIIKNNTVDFLGANYYNPVRIQAPDPKHKHAFGVERFYQIFEWEGARMNKSRGWEIYPEALYDIAMIIKNEYNNIDWYVSESGMGIQGENKFKDKTGKIQDDYRIEFIKEHLIHLKRGIDDGSNCFGYCLWAPLDCWSWNNAYKNRYGLIEVNLQDQSRRIKKSGEFFKELSDSKEIK